MEKERINDLKFFGAFFLVMMLPGLNVMMYAVSMPLLAKEYSEKGRKGFFIAFMIATLMFLWPLLFVFLYTLVKNG